MSKQDLEEGNKVACLIPVEGYSIAESVQQAEQGLDPSNLFYSIYQSYFICVAHIHKSQFASLAMTSCVLNPQQEEGRTRTLRELLVRDPSPSSDRCDL